MTTSQTFERPAGFILDSAWDQVVGEVEDKRSRTWATLLIAERFVWVLRDHFGRHCHPCEVLADGRAGVRVGAPTPRDIARTLSGWGRPWKCSTRRRFVPNWPASAPNWPDCTPTPHRRPGQIMVPR